VTRVLALFASADAELAGSGAPLFSSEDEEDDDEGAGAVLLFSSEDEDDEGVFSLFFSSLTRSLCVLPST